MGNFSTTNELKKVEIKKPEPKENKIKTDIKKVDKPNLKVEKNL